MSVTTHDQRRGDAARAGAHAAGPARRHPQRATARVTRHASTSPRRCTRPRRPTLTLGGARRRPSQHGHRGRRRRSTFEFPDLDAGRAVGPAHRRRRGEPAPRPQRRGAGPLRSHPAGDGPVNALHGHASRPAATTAGPTTATTTGARAPRTTGTPRWSRRWPHRAGCWRRGPAPADGGATPDRPGDRTGRPEARARPPGRAGPRLRPVGLRARRRGAGGGGRARRRGGRRR